MAPRTEDRLTRDLMLDAVPNSSASILLTLEIWSFGGMIRLKRSEHEIARVMKMIIRKYVDKLLIIDLYRNGFT